MVGFKNRLLSRLDADAVERLHLKPVALGKYKEIESPGKPIEHVFFVESGVGSMTTAFRDGAEVEVGLFGFEAVLGVQGLMGMKRSLHRIYMQIAGEGYVSSIDAARAEFDRGEEFHSLALLSAQEQFALASQTAACNARHTLAQRLSRWLLLCGDRVGERIAISHEFLGTMLGVTRPSVTIACGTLKRDGLIAHNRNLVEILDRAGLERAACECYRAVKDHLEKDTE